MEVPGHHHSVEKLQLEQGFRSAHGDSPPRPASRTLEAAQGPPTPGLGRGAELSSPPCITRGMGCGGRGVFTASLQWPPGEQIGVSGRDPSSQWTEQHLSFRGTSGSSYELILSFVQE